MKIRHILLAIIMLGTMACPGAAVAEEYEVKAGDTLFSLSRHFDVSIEELREANPQLDDGLRVGDILTIPAKTVPFVHTVEKGETVYGISRHYGVPIDTLTKLNPDIRDGLHAGMVLTIRAADEAVVVPAVVVPDVVVPDEVVPELPADSVFVVVEEFPPESDVIVSLLLPFMLNQERPEKGAQRHTEFLKGFLLAVDSLRSSGMTRGRMIEINAYDTCNDPDSLTALLEKDNVRRSQLIIAPDTEEQLHLVGFFGSLGKPLVMNNFVVRDRGYMSMRGMLQANIPQDEMMARTVSEIADNSDGYAPVIFIRDGETGPHQAFIDLLTAELENRGKTLTVITYKDRLKAADVEPLKGLQKPLMFFTSNGSQSELNRLIPDLKEYPEIVEGCVLFGYPEWVTYRGKTLTLMHDMNTTIYSRFFLDPESPEYQQFHNSFANRYEAETMDAMPNQAVLGFDVGMWAIPMLLEGDDATHRHEGLQSGFAFQKGEGLGMSNRRFYLVNYLPDGKTVIKRAVE